MESDMGEGTSDYCFFYCCGTATDERNVLGGRRELAKRREGEREGENRAKGEQSRTRTRTRKITTSDDERHHRGHLKLNKEAPRGHNRIVGDEEEGASSLVALRRKK